MADDDEVVIACTSAILASCVAAAGTIVLSNEKRRHETWIRKYIGKRLQLGAFNFWLILFPFVALLKTKLECCAIYNVLLIPKLKYICKCKARLHYSLLKATLKLWKRGGYIPDSCVLFVYNGQYT